MRGGVTQRPVSRSGTPNLGRQVTLRGHVDILQDAEMLRRFTETFLIQRAGGKAPSEERLQEEIAKFDAPDRHMMQRLGIRKAGLMFWSTAPG